MVLCKEKDGGRAVKTTCVNSLKTRVNIGYRVRKVNGKPDPAFLEPEVVSSLGLTENGMKRIVLV